MKTAQMARPWYDCTAMSDRTGKQLAEQVLARLPDDATVEDVQYSLYVADLVRRRSAALDATLEGGLDDAVRSGRLVSHEDVAKRMARWLRK